MSNENPVNETWFSYEGRNFLISDNIEAVACEVLFGKENLTLPAAPSDLAVHPAEFLDENGQHDFELLLTCPADLPELWEDERQEWAVDICRRARTPNLKNLEPSRLVRMMLGEKDEKS